MENVVIMVSEGYPLRFSANNTKSRYLALGLREAGCKVALCDSVFGTKGMTAKQEGISEEGLDYLILPRQGKTRSVFSNIIHIWRFLKKRKMKGAHNHVILGLERYPFFLVLTTIASLLGYSKSCLFHEWHCGIKQKTRIFQWEANVRDKTFGYFLDALFPISHFLEDRSKKFHKPMMLLPVLADFSESVAQADMAYNHFTYCCGAGFLERNTMVVDAFVKMKELHPEVNCQLVLIVVGNEKEIGWCEHYVSTLNKGNDIILRYQVPSHELTALYQSSIALVAPLDPNNIQDHARFSQKIAEYVATGRPIITNNVGEIPYYFEDGKSACIISYNMEDFAQNMWILANSPHQARQIGHQGYQVGKNAFNLTIVGRDVAQFICSLKND